MSLHHPHWLAATIPDGCVPVAVCFRLVIRHNLETHRLVGHKARATVQPDERLAHHSEFDGQLIVLAAAGIGGCGQPIWLPGKVAA